MKLKILNANYHRNGSSSCEGFFAVLFQDKEAAKDCRNASTEFVATFQCSDEPADKIAMDTIRVMNVKEFDSKWRGDHFYGPLQEALKAYCKKLKLSEVSWSAAAIPQLYKPAKTAKS